MNTRLLCCVALASLGLMACPYASKFPIAAPEAAPDARFGGLWKHTGKADYYRVTVGNDNKLQVKNGLSGADDRLIFYAWASKVEDMNFMNVQSWRNGDTVCYLYKIDTLTTTLCILSGLGRNAVTEPYSAKDLRRQIVKAATGTTAFPGEEKLSFTKLPD